MRSMVKVFQYIRERSREPLRWLFLNSSERQALRNMREYRDATAFIKEQIRVNSVTSEASIRSTYALHLLQDATKHLKD
jgi:hypothetical protein